MWCLQECIRCVISSSDWKGSRTCLDTISVSTWISRRRFSAPGAADSRRNVTSLLDVVSQTITYLRVYAALFADVSMGSWEGQKLNVFTLRASRRDFWSLVRAQKLFTIQSVVLMNQCGETSPKNIYVLSYISSLFLTSEKSRPSWSASRDVYGLLHLLGPYCYRYRCTTIKITSCSVQCWLACGSWLLVPPSLSLSP